MSDRLQLDIEMTGNLETVQKETPRKPRRMDMIFNLTQGSICILVGLGPNWPTDLWLPVF